MCLVLSELNEDGILLLEVNRMLRAGGYFAWAAQPVYKHEEALEQQWEGMIWIQPVKVNAVISRIVVGYTMAFLWWVYSK